MSRFIRKLHLRNLLSFDDCEVELRDLNVLIGPNGAGKSNLIEAIGLLRSLAYDHGAYLRQGGGAAAWIWKGPEGPTSAQMDTYLDGGVHGDLRHSFQVNADSAGLRWERLYFERTQRDVFNRDGGQLVFEGGPPTAFAFGESVFRHYKNPVDSGPTTGIGSELEAIRIYREFRTGKSESVRIGFGSGEGTRLDEGGQNLALVLHDLDLGERLEAVKDLLGELNQAYRRVKPRFSNGVWIVQLDEEGLLDPIPSQRISDGTLKFLCLAALLLDPKPPPLICLEEPEVGLHPDAMRVVAKLLLEASERTQLIVTTHSVDLVNEFSAAPEVVMVTEKESHNATRFSRLDRGKLKSWLERYKLGELWQKGEIGGNRW